MLKHKQAYRIFLALVISLTGCLSPVLATAASSKTPAKSTDSSSAATTSNEAIPTIAQSYTTATPLQQGIIVQLASKSAASVTAANYKNAKQMLGVVVSATNAPVSLSTDASGQQVYVVSSGHYNVLVSTQNGAISTGDYVSISAIDGLGMKADTTEPEILGRALGNFDGHSNVISTTSLKMSDGKQLKVAIGSVAVNISIGTNPQQASGSNGVPQFVQKLALTLVGKPINGPQLYISMAILLSGIAVVASLLYGGIQTGMTAIGRNPLARQSILRNLIQVIVTGVMIFIGCLIAVYLILKI